MARALVLGFSGFVGRELWRALGELNYSLVGVSSNLLKFSSAEESREKIYFHKAELLSALEALEFDHIFLSANYFSRNPNPTSLEREKIHYANLVLPLEVVSQAQSNKTTVCNLGSFWALPGHEMRSLPYSQAKAGLVRELEKVVGRSRLINFFLTDTYGPGDRRGKVVQRMMESRVSKSSFDLQFPSTIISISHVADLVATILDTVVSRRSGNFLAIGSYNLELGELLRAVEKRPYKTLSALDFLRQSDIILNSEIELLRIANSRDLMTSLGEIERGLE